MSLKQGDMSTSENTIKISGDLLVNPVMNKNRTIGFQKKLVLRCYWHSQFEKPGAISSHFHKGVHFISPISPS